LQSAPIIGRASASEAGACRHMPAHAQKFIEQSPAGLIIIDDHGINSFFSGGLAL
jgi:hypothetical protein